VIADLQLRPRGFFQQIAVPHVGRLPEYPSLYECRGGSTSP
jgi:hypothetical protein